MATEGSGGERTASEREWLRVHAYLQRHRYELAVRAAGSYPAGTRVAGTPLLAAPPWLPAAPVPLGGIRLAFRPDAPAPRITDAAAISPGLFPRRPDGNRYERHSDVVRELAAPTIFENRSTYRLAAADLAGAQPRLDFTLGRYFDGIDIGGAVAHEYAAHECAAREWAASEDARRGDHGEPAPSGQRLRTALGDPCDLTAHSATVAVAVLTLRHDRTAGTASFPLHWRDPARVGHAGGMFQVIPVGIFQPSGEAAWNVPNDFSLWRGALREYAEELLGAGEDHGSEMAPIDYASWPLARRMTDALHDGRIRAWCLGLGTDPLTFAMDLLTVVVIDAPLYDELFGGAVADNAEGAVLPPRPFTAESVDRLLGEHPVQAAGAALLRLARTHADTLLGALPPVPVVDGAGYQPRSRHSSRCGRSAPSVVSLPWPGYTQVSSGSGPKSFSVTSLCSDWKRSGSFCVFPTPPGNRVWPVRLSAPITWIPSLAPWLTSAKVCERTGFCVHR